jgi:hypothetical protein
MAGGRRLSFLAARLYSVVPLRAIISPLEEGGFGGRRPRFGRTCPKLLTVLLHERRCGLQPNASGAVLLDEGALAGKFV